MMHVAASVSRLSSMRQRVGAAVVKGGRILGVGCNRPGSSTRTPSSWSRHAELQAIVNAGDVRGATIYVYSERRDGTIRLAKPCVNCAELIRTAGIKKVVYSEG